jgi:hypothetical protein
VPFDWLTTLSAETVVPNFSSSTPQAATVDWTVTLQSVTVRYSPLGDVIPGAHVDLVPEPGTVYLAIAGIFICVLRRATVSLTEDAVAVRRAHLESAQPGLRMRVD